jgi:diguanylate cyclase (GGDEF)-like protein
MERSLNFAHLSLTAKLALIHLLLAAVMLGVVVVAWRHLPSRDDATDAAQLSRAQRATQTADMMHDALHADVLTALLLKPASPAQERERAQHSVRENAQVLNGELAALAAMKLDPALKAEIETARTTAVDYVQQAQDMVALALTEPQQAQARKQGFDASFEATKLALAAQTDLVARHLDDANDVAQRATDDARRGLLVAAIAAVIGGWFIVALIARSIRRSLMALRDVARDVAAGQLERRSPVNGGDEVGALAASVNQMADNLHQMIERMRVDADRGAFGARLISALDMADSEPQAHQVVAHAMAEISPVHPMELLLADSSDAHLENAASHPLAGAPGCAVDSPFSCVAVRRGHTVSFADSRALDACPKLRGRAAGAVAATCVPVTFMGRAMGVLHAQAPLDAPLDEGAVERLGTLGVQIGGRIGTVRAFERTQLQASTDALTGLHNRRSIEARLRDLMRQRQPFTLVMADLDHFKRLNDTHGHQAGDEALRAFADVVRDAMRAHDAAGRYGGEEFALVLTDTSAAQALQWVDRLRARLAGELRRRSAPAFTASFGIADSSAGPPLEAVISAADRALYAAKGRGRDCGVVATLADATEAAPQRVSEQRAALNPHSLVVNA